jgi:hypothetical protein
MAGKRRAGVTRQNGRTGRPDNLCPQYNPKSVPCPDHPHPAPRRLTFAVSNETDYAMDLLALSRFIAAAIATCTWPRHPRTISPVKSLCSISQECADAHSQRLARRA